PVHTAVGTLPHAASSISSDDVDHTLVDGIHRHAPKGASVDFGTVGAGAHVLPGGAAVLRLEEAVLARPEPHLRGVERDHDVGAAAARSGIRTAALSLVGRARR